MEAGAVFTALPLPCIILNANRRTKNRGRAGNEAKGTELCHYTFSCPSQVYRRSGHFRGKIISILNFRVQNISLLDGSAM